MGPPPGQRLAAHRGRLRHRPRHRQLQAALGLPYGEKPRLVLIHLATEAVRTGSPVVDVEESMTAFARSLGIETNGQQLRSLKDQLARLAAATVRMGVVEEGRAVQVQTHFVSAFDLWFPKQADQRVPVAVHGAAERGVFPEPGAARRAARPPGGRRPGVVVDGPGRVRLAGPAAAPGTDRQAAVHRLGIRCMSSSGRASPASATSAAGSSRPCTTSSRPTRQPGCRPTTGA